MDETTFEVAAKLCIIMVELGLLVGLAAGIVKMIDWHSEVKDWYNDLKDAQRKRDQWRQERRERLGRSGNRNRRNRVHQPA